ncbi:MAG: MBL fold metallo-hydrolase [Pseudobutyrivibrio sp.]|nr:MBL fold metallo-hydrolase [Pseudobutyrivibrio sp.]
MKITVLVENTAINDNFEAEHGLSLFIQHHDRKILLDAGSTDLFAKNAQKLGIDLDQVDYAVLSHGHYDHSGGFEKFFEINKHAKCYAHMGMDGEFYSSKGGMHYIGVPENVLRMEGRFKMARGLTPIDDGVYLLPHSTPDLTAIAEKAGLYRKVNGEFILDDFSHEQSLVIETSQGLVVFNSCSHSGAGAIIDEAKRAFGKNVYAYFGGLHMKGRKNGIDTCTFSSDQLDELADKIKAENVMHVFTGHCTGLPGLAELEKRLPGIVEPLATGKIIEI